MKGKGREMKGNEGKCKEMKGKGGGGKAWQGIDGKGRGVQGKCKGTERKQEQAGKGNPATEPCSPEQCNCPCGGAPCE